MRNLIQTAATIRNVFGFGQDAAIASTSDKRYSLRSSHLNRAASHSGYAYRASARGTKPECRRGLARWLTAAVARLNSVVERNRLALLGTAMRPQPVVPCMVRRLTVR